MEDKRLTSKERSELKSSQFCGPGRSFPVNDCAHVRAAFRLINRAKVSDSVKARIRSCINKKNESMSCGVNSDYNESDIDELIDSEIFDDTHLYIDFLEKLEADTLREDQKLRMANLIVSLKNDKGQESDMSDYIERSLSSIIDSLLDELEAPMIDEEKGGYQPPAGAKGNAQRVLNWKKEKGSEVKGMTSVGWARARQLASGRPISLSTVSRMAQFNRHRKNAAVDPKFKGEPWKDAGYVAWLGWGGTTGIDWAIRTMKSQKGK